MTSPAGRGDLDTAVLEASRLEALMRAGLTLTSDLNIDAVLAGVLETACELTGARYAALGILDADREHLAHFVTHGSDNQTRRAIGALPRGRGVLIEDLRPQRIRDVGEHPCSYGFPPGHPPTTSFLGVAITIRGVVWGNLYRSSAKQRSLIIGRCRCLTR